MYLFFHGMNFRSVKFRGPVTKNELNYLQK